MFIDSMNKLEIRPVRLGPYWRANGPSLVYIWIMDQTWVLIGTII